jgi:preprotein translocase subunit SecA
LNARKHTEESQIIAGAGAFGAVTIATNMAGRGVDIKLGGELAEEVLAAVNRLLRRNGVENPYDLTMAERHAALQAIPPADYGIYEAEVQFFFRYMDDMARVRALGGLHVIGSERHEARRIDNQLRGRSARQGDPGSSRFFLAMDDDLMRLFGGQQADGIMQRFKIDDEFPLEFSIVGRIIEQSQTRVEGSNFDVRKHLLEYDDVLNSQRARIYAQRDRIFHKDDLSEDVEDMLRIELTRRVPAALKDEDGPWKLLDWLDQIQPTLSAGGFLYPPFSLQVLVERSFADGVEALPAETARQALLHIASESLDAEETHLVRAFTGWFDQGLERLQAQIEERREAIEAFFEGLDLEEEGQEKPSARQLAEELNNLARVQLRLTNDQQRALASSPKPLQPLVIDQITAALTIQALTRIMGAIERRLNEPLNLANVDASDWALAANQIITAVHTVFDGRRARLIGQRSDGQIARELQEFLDRVPGMINRQQFLYLLLNLREGRRAVFDKKTHRRLEQRTTRLVYVFFAAQLLESSQPEQISARVLEHLEGAQDLLRSIWGRSEWTRLSNAPVAELDPATRNALRLTLGEATYTQVENATLAGLTADEREAAVETLGRRVLTELYRQMLLAVITELWVDYLTQMEALRVSIGLEAYGQRDPLVQYKNRASGLFQDLLGNMRLSVISRMFTYQPRSGAPQAAQTAARSVAGRSDDPESEAAGALAGDAFIPENSDSAAEPEDEEGGEADETGEEGDRPGQAAPRAEGGGKRRRRRRR